MNLRASCRKLIAIALATSLVGQVASAEKAMRVDVDTTQMPRHLLHSSIYLPAPAGSFAFWYPEWIPGIHGPSEQIRNIGGLSVSTEEGQELRWRRDPAHLNRFEVQVPHDTTLRVDLTYIANQPTRVSTGVDSYGNSSVVVVNFNTCIVYPEGADLRKLPVDVRVKLPDEFQFATPLSSMTEEDDAASPDWNVFATTTVETFVDSPLIASRNYRRLDTEVAGQPPVRYHFVSESAKALEFDQTQADRYRQLVAEAYRLFGGAPFSHYDFLVICSDRIPGLGLEHHESSLNAVKERDVVDEEKRKGRSVYLLPHELAHAWCGKYRRPVGMYRSDYHHPKQTGELWIYEGLTQYLGHVLTVRAGLLTFEEHLARTAGRIGYLSNRSGRSWRPLEDTAVAAYTLRGGSQSWNDLRRNQDYYDEGAFFWMEADATIRRQSGGERSLDDFCRAFFAWDQAHPKVKPFRLEEIVKTLNDTTPYDWAGLIKRRIQLAHPEFSLEGLRKTGYQFSFVAEKPDYVSQRETDRKYISAEYSLGLIIDEDGQITSVVPGSPADRAGLADHLKILGANDLKFSAKRLHDALKDAESSGEISLLTEEGEAFHTFVVPYRGGPRYPAIQRIDGQQDVLGEICRPRAGT